MLHRAVSSDAIIALLFTCVKTHVNAEMRGKRKTGGIERRMPVPSIVSTH